MLEPDGLADRVGEPVHPRHPVLVRAVQAGQPQHGPFHRHRGVRPGQVGDRLPGQPGQLAGLRDERRIEVQLAGHDRHPPFEQFPYRWHPADQVQREVRVAGNVPVADQHRHIRGQALGAESRRAEARGHGEENYRAALLRGQDRAAFAAWHVYAHDRDVGRSPCGFYFFRESYRVSGVGDHYCVDQRGLRRPEVCRRTGPNVRRHSSGASVLCGREGAAEQGCFFLRGDHTYYLGGASLAGRCRGQGAALSRGADDQHHGPLFHHAARQGGGAAHVHHG